LISLQCITTRVSDLSPLVGVPLTSVALAGSPVSDLSPLAGMTLKSIRFSPKTVTRGIDVIRRMESLEKIGFSGGVQDYISAAEFWKRYDAGEFGKPQ
jgi:hypothetical protein